MRTGVSYSGKPDVPQPRTKDKPLRLRGKNSGSRGKSTAFSSQRRRRDCFVGCAPVVSVCFHSLVRTDGGGSAVGYVEKDGSTVTLFMIKVGRRFRI